MEELSIKDLQKYPYPNLMAEIKESNYSICTIGDHMRLGKYLPENSPEVWDRLTGKKELLTSEAVALSNLFGVELKYLFDDELTVINEKPLAYWRWIRHNKRREREFMEYKVRQGIDRALREKPFLLPFISQIITMSEEEISAALAEMKKGGTVSG